MKKLFILTVFVCCIIQITAQNQPAASKYFNTQMAILDSIKPLTNHERQQIDSIFTAKWQVSENLDFAFHEAMCGILTSAQYFRQYFKNQIAKRSWVILNDDLHYFRQTQKLPESALKQIRPVLRTACLRRNFRKPAFWLT
jgi:hypothetical protein